MSNLSIQIIHSTQLDLLVQHFQRLVPETLTLNIPVSS
jgi:hypothetical protein